MKRFAKDSVFLVTGGAGFIGSNCAEKLLGAGFEVRVLDDFSTGKRENIASFKDEPRFTLIEGDIRDLETCQKACRGVDYVLHQAALGSVPRSIADPLTTHDVNTTGMLHMLIAARDQKVKSFVYASSSSVYGDHPQLPKKEGREGVLLSPYAVSKRNNEDYAKVFSDLYDLNTVGLRYFNVFGPRQDPGSAYSAVIPKFLSHMLSGTAPVIFGDGEQSRDFTYIDNVIQANLLACEASSASGRAYNIGCGGRLTLNELYATIEQVLGTGLSPLYGPVRQGDIKHSHADITAARNDLGYEPEISVFEGMKKSMDWYQTYIQKANQETV